jgi:hypothetical protein
MAKYKRRIKLIKPEFQNRLTLVFLGMSALGMIIQFILFHATLGEFALMLPTDGALLIEVMNQDALRVLAISLFVILPLSYVVGVLTTFRIAGPLHRIETHLTAIVNDGYTGPCRTRNGDKLQELVDCVNEATLSLSQSSAVPIEASKSNAA